jgi:mannose-6-phosphate isomerase-like protein (cupin superfamily)
VDAARQIRAAEVVLPCDELDETLTFFTERLGFRLETISPADDPAIAVIEGGGVRLRLERGSSTPPGTLRLRCTDPAAMVAGETSLTAPNGTRIELVAAEPALVMPASRPSFVVNRSQADASWVAGRAGMRYRDLIPDRQGGRVVASHIQIPDGGPVPDYVHYHHIAFQLIYCVRGWVRVVYEDQGPPFVLDAGDCVLQPPGIRHRVLESSPGLEVVEITSPARHDTFVDHNLSLPTADVRPERAFGGQRFVRHRAAVAEWQPWRTEGFDCRDTGIATATGGLVGARVVRWRSGSSPELASHHGELAFHFVLAGSVTLQRADSAPERLGRDDSVVVPAELPYALVDASADLELLEVTAPAM